MSRNHFYTYTVGVRTVITVKDIDKNGKELDTTHEETTWPLSMVTHCANIHEVAGRLHKDLDDIRYERKEIEK